MSDDADLANDTAAVLLDAALANRRAARAELQCGRGFCLNCAAEIERPLRWCDEQCREDWERTERNKQLAWERQLIWEQAAMVGPGSEQ